LSFYEEVRVGVLKIEESESELLCTDSTALVITEKYNVVVNNEELIDTTEYLTL
jgi:hypothetical protein